MPTVVDELVVTLGLDPTKFTAGQKAAADALLKTRDNAVKTGKEIELRSKAAAEFMSKLRGEVLALGAAFIGGRGLKDFAAYLTTSDAALGRLSRNLGVSSSVISQWQGLARLFGGSAEEMAASFTTLSDALAGWKVGIITGDMMALFRQLGALGGTIIDPAGKSVDQMMGLIADNLRSVNKKDPALAGLMGRRLGIDPALFDAMINPAFRTFLDQMRALNSVTNKNTEAADRLQKAWNTVVLASENVGREILTGLEPALTGALDFIAEGARTVAETNKHPRNAAEVAAQIRSGQAAPSVDQMNDAWARALAWIRGQQDSPAARAIVGAQAAAPGTLGAYATQVKDNAGTASPAIAALADYLQQHVSGIGRFSAFNDAYHAGTGSAHERGLALDFVLRDPRTSAAVAEQVRATLAAMGVGGRVIDEYLNPSARSTGGHIHVQFNSADEARKYLALQGAGSTAALAGGAAGAAATGADNRRTSTVSSETHVHQLTVNGVTGANAGVADSVREALDRQQRASQINYGMVP